jgi:hypothetical protein
LSSGLPPPPPPPPGTQLPSACHVFTSPSAFSIFVKRLFVPSRKADDGWKSVLYQGKVRA